MNKEKTKPKEKNVYHQSLHGHVYGLLGNAKFQAFLNYLASICLRLLKKKNQG